jgi:hypothetical protein
MWNEESVSAMMELAASIQTKKKQPLAPGGPGTPAPAPRRIRSQNGVSESEYIQSTLMQLMGVGQPTPGMQPQMPGQAMPGMPTGSPTMPGNQGPVQGVPQNTGGEIMGLLAGMMGGGGGQ